MFRHLLIEINCKHLFGSRIQSVNDWENHVIRGGPPDGLSRAVSDYPKRGLLVSGKMVFKVRFDLIETQKGVMGGYLLQALQLLPIQRVSAFCDSDAILSKVLAPVLQGISQLAFTDAYVVRQRAPSAISSNGSYCAQ